MSLYDLMEETVDKICKSLEEEPHKWKFETCTFTKKGTGIEYWCSGDGPVVDIWLGSGRNQVFLVNKVIVFANHTILQDKDKQVFFKKKLYRV